MSERFVRLFRYDPDRDPTARLRLDYDPMFGNAILADETTFLEKVNDPDARVRDILFSVQLTTACVRWLHESTGELYRAMEADNEALQRELDEERAAREGQP